MNPIPKPNPKPDPKLMLPILYALYHGPRYFVKVGEADFGNFLVIILIQAKVNAANDFKPYPKRLPKGSIRKIQEFIRIFPILSDHQKAILAHFIDDRDVEGFLCEHFGSDYQTIIDKYEPIFKWMVPRLFHHGLEISHLYQGRYACSCAKWVVVKLIFSIISEITPNVSATIAGKQLSPNSARIAFVVSVMQDYGENHILKMYLKTINDFEKTGDGDCFSLAEKEFNKSLVTNEKDHQEWLELHTKFKDSLGYSFALHPQRWNFNLICWLMNGFENYDQMLQYIAEMMAYFSICC
jgi:hypothetical protein